MSAQGLAISYVPQKDGVMSPGNACVSYMEKQFHFGWMGRIFSHRKSLVFKFARSLKQ
jgi:hypothetical protein